jgi:hypothetical protein
MKKILFLIAGAFALASCEEKGPVIDFGELSTTDTTYKTDVPETPQQHKVLIEEFTGGDCPNCPDAAAIIKTLDTQTNFRLVTMGMHVYGIGQSAPVPDLAQYDFRTQDGTDIMNQYYGNLEGIPLGGVDRVPYNSKIAIGRGQWPAAINDRLATTPDANVHLSSEYTPGTRTALIKVTIAYTQSVTKAQAVSLAIIEDGIVDYQAYPTFIEPNYTFNHVLRDFITNINGITLDPSVVKEPGRVFEIYIPYTVPAEWNVEKCKLVAFLHNVSPDGKDIIQAEEAELD